MREETTTFESGVCARCGWTEHGPAENGEACLKCVRRVVFGKADNRDMKPGHETRRPFIRATIRCTACRFVATLGQIKLDGNVDADAPSADIDQYADMGEGLLLHVNDGAHVPMLELAPVLIP